MADNKKRPNYFILLGLMGGNQEPDEQSIQDAIGKKGNQWSREQNNPSKHADAAKNLEMMDDIKRVMSDPSARKAEYEEAKIEKQNQEQDLQENLSFYAIDMEELSDKAISRLLKKYEKYGFSKEEIEDMFQKIVSGGTDVELPPVISEDIAKRINNLFRQLGMENSTLYDFLGMNKRSSCSELCQKADAERQRIQQKGNQVGSDSARVELCGLCSTVFKDTDSKNRYDNYIRLTAHGDLNDQIDEMAEEHNNVFSEKLMEAFVDRAVQQYQISGADAYDYVAGYCALKGYVLAGVDRNSIIQKYGWTQTQPNSQMAAFQEQQLIKEQEKKQLESSLKCGKRAIDRMNELNIEVNYLNNNKPHPEYGRRILRIIAIVLIVFITVYLVCEYWSACDYHNKYYNDSSYMELFTPDELEKRQKTADRDMNAAHSMILHWGIVIIILIILTVRWTLCIRQRKAQIEEYPIRIKEIKGEIANIQKQNAADLNILPEAYRYDAGAYDRALQYLDEGIANNIEDVKDLLKRGI